MESTPRKPVGNTEEFHFYKWVWTKLAVQLRFINSPTVQFEVTTKGISAHAKPSRGGGSEGNPCWI
jgi:hypothetical protein